MRPEPGEISRNRDLVQHGLEVAAAEGAQWVVTPELCVSGYGFQKMVGTDWIMPQPDSWMTSIQRLVKDKRLTVFLSHPERVLYSTKPAQSVPDSRREFVGEERLYNSVFVIGPQGDILGVYRKIKTTGAAEAWSTAGEQPVVVDCGGIWVGLLICADAWFPEIAKTLKDEGADILISSAAWPPGLHGPEDCWERRTAETGLPLWVCNRTGREDGINLDYR